MVDLVNVYCDESCHLEHDHIPVMVLGAAWCSQEAVADISAALRDLKARHGLPPSFETKWVKVSPAKLEYYRDVVDLFFDDYRLRFRAVVIPDKSRLNHAAFGQLHDDWYYKMYFVMLKHILDPRACYHIYLDIKDTRSQAKVARLHDVLCNNMYDFDRAIIGRVQQVRSHEVEVLQVADLLIGALSYVNRGLTGSEAKMALVEHIRGRSGLCLTRTTLMREDKVNILVWNPQEG